MTTAGFFRRILADVLDTLIVSFFLFFIGLISGEFQPETLRALELLVAFFYFPLLESSRWQRTAGQWCLNMYVCSTNDERLSLGRAFYREIMKFLLALPLSIFFACLFLLFFFIAKLYLPPEIALTICMILFFFSTFVGAFIMYYVRLFNNHQQTMRDYFTRTKMMLSVRN